MFWRRSRAERDFSSELRAHIDLEADRLRAEGLSDDEAYGRARKTFGNVTPSHRAACFGSSTSGRISATSASENGERLQFRFRTTCLANRTLAVALYGRRLLFAVRDSSRINRRPESSSEPNDGGLTLLLFDNVDVSHVAQRVPIIL